MNNSKPYSKEFIQEKINVAKAGMGKVKVPVLYREQLSTGYSSLPIVGMGTKPLGEIRPQMFSVKSEEGRGTGNPNHQVRVYRSIEDTVLNKEYEIITRRGTYVTKIVADEKLVVDMPYIGKGKQNTNSEGWLRDNKYYFNEIYRLHPEYFSDANIKNLNNGWAIVNGIRSIK
ncbi:hypothetical protein [Bacillus aquiflavi]|nr:hypothetical protein [Bacillus aquiflavi]